MNSKDIRTQEESPAGADLGAKFARLCPVCGSDMSGYHGNAETCSEKCGKLYDKQALRRKKRDREQRAYEKFKAFIKEIHNADAVEIAQEARKILVKVWETENIYTCETRSILRRSYNIHGANKCFAMLERERKAKYGNGQNETRT